MDKDSLLKTLNALRIKVDMHQSGGEKVIAYCPFAPWKHKNKTDTRPSFAAFVNEEGLSGFLCMACREKGTIGALVNKLGDLRGEEYADLIDEVGLSEEYGLTHFPEYEDMKSAPADTVSPEPLNEALYHGIYTSPLDDPEARDYLGTRQISEIAVTACELLYDAEERRILFPVRGQDRRLYGYSGRSLDPSHPLKVKDYAGLSKRSFILGEHKFDKSKPILVVEGLFGYAHLHEIGADNHFNIGALLGMVLTDEKRDTLRLLGLPVYLLLDNDHGGTLGIFGNGSPDDLGAAAELLGHVPLYIPQWPDGKTDPDELSLNELLDMLENTPPVTPEDLK